MSLEMHGMLALVGEEGGQATAPAARAGNGEGGGT